MQFTKLYAVTSVNISYLICLPPPPTPHSTLWQWSKLMLLAKIVFLIIVGKYVFCESSV